LIKNILQSSRPKQWIKSLLLMVVPIISGEIINWTAIQYLRLFLGVLSFIFLASAIYFLNDLKDINLDRSHPSKSNRPIPSGKITKLTALIWITIYLITALSVGILVDQHLFYLQVCYLLISISYIYIIKFIPYWEMISISTGFIIRSAAGAVFVNIKPSYFFYSIIFSIAFTIVCAKRMSEVISTNILKRNVISHYSKELLSGCIIIATSLSLILYVLFIFSSRVNQTSNNLTLTLLIATILPFIIILLEIMKMALDGASEIVEDIYLKNSFILINFFLLVLMYMTAILL
jgi:decaprenyl-phosphate phosphoribosyltransferase